VVTHYFFQKEVFVMTSERSHTAMPITRKSIRTTHEYPQFFRGSVYVASGLFLTDRQYRRSLKKARKIKLKK
jgi:hypothetical protein